MDLLFVPIAIYYDFQGKRDIAAFIYLCLLSSVWQTLQEFSWPPIPRRMADLAFILGIYLVYRTWKNRDKHQVLPPAIHNLLLLSSVCFLFSILIALFQGISISDIFKALRFYHGTILTFLVLVTLNTEQLKSLVKYILILNAIICVLIIVQFLTGIQIFKYALSNYVTSEMGTYGLYPPFSLWLSFVILISAYGNKFSTLLRSCGIILCLGIAALTMIRSFISSVVISAGVIMITSTNKKMLLNSLLLLVILGTIAWMLMGSAIYNRLFARDDSSLTYRSDSFEYAIEMCNTNAPFFGGSLENVLVDDYGIEGMSDKFIILCSPDHNGAFLLKFGWCGLISWLMLLWLPPLLLWKKHHKSPFMIPLLLCCFVYIPISATCSNNLLRPHTMIPYVLLYFCTLKISPEAMETKIADTNTSLAEEKAAQCTELAS